MNSNEVRNAIEVRQDHHVALLFISTNSSTDQDSLKALMHDLCNDAKDLSSVETDDLIWLHANDSDTLTGIHEKLTTQVECLEQVKDLLGDHNIGKQRATHLIITRSLFRDLVNELKGPVSNLPKEYQQEIAAQINDFLNSGQTHDVLKSRKFITDITDTLQDIEYTLKFIEKTHQFDEAKFSPLITINNFCDRNIKGSHGATKFGQLLRNKNLENHIQTSRKKPKSEIPTEIPSFLREASVKNVHECARQLEIHLRDNYQDTNTNKELNDAFHEIFGEFIAKLRAPFKETFQNKQDLLLSNGGPFYSYRRNKRSR